MASRTSPCHPHPIAAGPIRGFAALAGRAPDEPTLRLIVGFSSMAGFVVAGLGLRIGWLELPAAGAIGALALAGYGLALLNASRPPPARAFAHPTSGGPRSLLRPPP